MFDADRRPDSIRTSCRSHSLGWTESQTPPQTRQPKVPLGLFRTAELVCLARVGEALRPAPARWYTGGAHDLRVVPPSRD